MQSFENIIIISKMLSNVISNLAKVYTVDSLVDFDRLFLDYEKIPTL